MFRPFQRNLEGFLVSQLPGPAVRVILGGDLCGKPPGAFAVKALAFALAAMGRWELWWCGGPEGAAGRQRARGALLGCE